MRAPSVRTRFPLMLVVLMSLVTGTFGSIVAIAVTPGTAEACSPPYKQLTVSPSSGLAPGDVFVLEGSGFFDVEIREVDPGTPVDSCGGQVFVPAIGLDVRWSDADGSRVVGVVSGFNFVYEGTVPENAADGRAQIEVDGWTVDIDVAVAEPRCVVTGDGAEVCRPICAVWCPPHCEYSDSILAGDCYIALPTVADESVGSSPQSLNYDPILPWTGDDDLARIAVTPGSAQGAGAASATTDIQPASTTSPGLAYTGGEIAVLGYIGAGLVAFGALALLGRRKLG